MGPWVPVLYEPGQLLIMVRNPYYWQVDEAGNQLPYIDEVWFTEAQSGEARTLNLIAGTGDRDHIENPQIFSVIRQASLDPNAHFTIQFGSYGIGYHLMMNLSLNKGIDGDEKELELRHLFRDLRFRQAVAHALDRDALADLAFPGPLTRAWEGGYPTGSSYYDESVVRRHGYDPEKSAELLAELGFKGYRRQRHTQLAAGLCPCRRRSDHRADCPRGSGRLSGSSGVHPADAPECGN